MTYVCTKCGWVGKRPVTQAGIKFCPKCPYAVKEVEE